MPTMEGGMVSDRDESWRKWRNRERGFTYIALLILIACMGAALAAESEVWYMAMKRDKEDQLLFEGHQFRMALNRYYYSRGGLPGRFPTSLEDLLKDPRYPDTRRYLRKIHLDPITGSANWGTVKGPNGEIYGVYSLSEEEPVKKANFSLEDAAFEGKKKYSDWKFMISARGFQVPLSTVPAPTAGATSGPAIRTMNR